MELDDEIGLLYCSVILDRAESRLGRWARKTVEQRATIHMRIEGTDMQVAFDLALEETLRDHEQGA